MENHPYLRFLIAGKLSRDYLILPDGHVAADIPGGSLLYAAAGLGVWDIHAGLIGRVGEDYPLEWLETFEKRGFDTRGVYRMAGSLDLRYFSAYTAEGQALTTDPVAHFSRLGQSFPKSLLGYAVPAPQIDSRTQASPITIRINEIPEDYFSASAAHLCPLDFLTHTLLPPSLRSGQVNIITLDPSAGYMNPTFWDDIPLVVSDLTAFISSEEKVRSLFHGRSTDLWEMAEALASYGCDHIVIQRGTEGVYLYDRSRDQRRVIPAYPVRMKDPTGAADAYCGGFLVGYRNTYDAFEACLFAGVSASFVIEGTGPAYALEAYPPLAQARYHALKDMARRV